MNIISFANQKGGVGKTTSAITVGSLLSRQGYRVLLIDLDPGTSLTSYFGFDPTASRLSTFQCFDNPSVDVASLIQRTNFDNLFLLQGSIPLATVDQHVGKRPGLGLTMSRAIQQIDGQYDFVLIDCLATMGILMVNAIAASNQLVIPVQCEHLAIEGLRRMLRTMAMIGKSNKSEVRKLVVPTMYDRRLRASHHALATLRKEFPEYLWDDVVPIDTQFRNASEIGMPLPEVNMNLRGVRAYQGLVEALILPQDSEHFSATLVG